jgi:hypothetical protein
MTADQSFDPNDPANVVPDDVVEPPQDPDPKPAPDQVGDAR